MNRDVIPAVSLKNISFSYGYHDAVSDVSLDISPRTLVAVVGPNGSGKSTLLKLISGYLRPQRGVVRVMGQDIASASPGRRSGLVAFAGDEPDPAFDFTVEETVLMGRIGRNDGKHMRQGAEDCSWALQEVSLKEMRDRPVSSLSSGERQRVYIARAIYQDPQVLLLDEPTAHLDMAYELSIMELVKELVTVKGKTVIVVLHDLNLAVRYASRILIMKDGVLVEDSLPESLSALTVKSVYGVEAVLLDVPQRESRVIVPIKPS